MTPRVEFTMDVLNSDILSIIAPIIYGRRDTTSSRWRNTRSAGGSGGETLRKEPWHHLEHRSHIHHVLSQVGGRDIADARY